LGEHKEKPVADEVSNKPGPFDVQTIKALVQLMARHDINEIDLRDGDQRLRLARGIQVPASEGYAPPPAAPSVAAAPVAATKEAAPAQPAARKLLEIKSPAVGTFYAAPNPETPAFVKVGDRVTPTTVVGLIEAMKLFNEVTADCNGIIEEIVVQNQQAVEFGELLFRVNPAG
jgi:acetyl-CoA carboxylase biotin carboxyl carrier protein